MELGKVGCNERSFKKTDQMWNVVIKVRDVAIVPQHLNVWSHKGGHGR